jgi:predicted TIM-barrel fold metal-dependent hydrolase
MRGKIALEEHFAIEETVRASAGWPFESIDHAVDRLAAATISENDRLKIGRDNARALFRLAGA